MLEDSAAELFLEQSYAATTIDQISSRAGVSRNTFFNYFGSKSDLLWVELDLAIDRLEEELADVDIHEPALAAVTAAILRAAAGIGSDRVPLALSQEDVIGSRAETRVSGLSRYARRADVIATFLARQLSRPSDDLIVLASANALSGALTAAWTVWARDGVDRRALADYVGEAVAVVSGGLKHALVLKL
jgi:AcrR family transcriptional regulator